MLDEQNYENKLCYQVTGAKICWLGHFNTGPVNVRPVYRRRYSVCTSVGTNWIQLLISFRSLTKAGCVLTGSSVILTSCRLAKLPIPDANSCLSLPIYAQKWRCDIAVINQFFTARLLQSAIDWSLGGLVGPRATHDRCQRRNLTCHRVRQLHNDNQQLDVIRFTSQNNISCLSFLPQSDLYEKTHAVYTHMRGFDLPGILEPFCLDALVHINCDSQVSFSAELQLLQITVAFTNIRSTSCNLLARRVGDYCYMTTTTITTTVTNNNRKNIMRKKQERSIDDDNIELLIK